MTCQTAGSKIWYRSIDLNIVKTVENGFNILPNLYNQPWELTKHITTDTRKN